MAQEQLLWESHIVAHQPPTNHHQIYPMDKAAAMLR
tara:strand:- start:128 stop:235 length:108 start_codon:yes stop_codon:yes gene_type:complete